MSAPYVVKSDAVAYLQQIKPTFKSSDLLDMIFNASGQILESKTNRVWNVTAAPQFTSGRNENFFYCPTYPIVSLSGIFLIAPDLTEESLIVSGSERQVVYNPATGFIKRIDGTFDISRDNDSQYGIPVVESINNIRIEGTFGVDASSVPALALLQTLIIQKLLGIQNPEAFMPKLSETIGEYKYTIDKGANKNSKSLDDYIDYLIEVVNDVGNDFVLAI